MFTYKIIDVQDQKTMLRVVLLSPEGQQLVVYSHLSLKKHLRVGFAIKFHTWNDSPFEWIDDGNGGLKGIGAPDDSLEHWKSRDTSSAWDSDEKLKMLARKKKDVKWLQAVGIRPDDDLNY